MWGVYGAFHSISSTPSFTPISDLCVSLSSLSLARSRALSRSHARSHARSLSIHPSVKSAGEDPSKVRKQSGKVNNEGGLAQPLPALSWTLPEFSRFVAKSAYECKSAKKTGKVFVDFSRFAARVRSLSYLYLTCTLPVPNVYLTCT